MAAVNFFESLNLNQNELQNAVLHPLPAAPSGAKAWQIYTNSTDGLIYQNVGTAAAPLWKPVGSVVSVNGKTGTVVLGKSDVGLGNADNTSDATKKANFTGAIAENNAGFPTGGAVYDALLLKLDLTGGTLTGAVAMSGNKITGLATGTNDGDAVNVAQLNEAISTSAAFFRGSFASKATLDAVAWQTTDPSAAYYVTNNDYAVVLDDETHDGECWRYIYVGGTGTGTGWQAQYRLNEAPFTQAQLDAINSGVTSALVAQIGTNQSNIAANAQAISGIKDGTTIDSFADVETALSGLIKTATGTIGTNETSATVSYSGTLINAYAMQGGAEILLDIAYGSGTVTFTVASAPSAEITCVVISC